MPYVIPESLEKIIVPSERIKRFGLNEEQNKLLQSAIKKIKMDQLEKLAAHIQTTFADLLDGENIDIVKKVIRITLFESLDISAPDKAAAQKSLTDLIDIYSVSLHSGENQHDVDRQLREKLKENNAEKHYLWAFNLRHLYYLDKPDPNYKENEKAFPVRISERMLVLGHKYVSRYLYAGQSEYYLTEDEKQIIHLVYKTKINDATELRENKILRREAHADITLTVYEIQSLIAGIAKTVLETGKAPEEGLVALPLITKQTPEEEQILSLKILSKTYSIYVNNDNRIILIHKTFEEISNYFNKYPQFVNSNNYHSDTCLLSFVIVLKRKELVKILLEKNAKIDSPDKKGYSPLHYAAEQQDPAFLQMLLDNKCDVNCVDEGGHTPIYIAAEQGNVECVKLLLSKGADPNIANTRYRSTALHIAVYRNQQEVIKVLLDSKKAYTNLLNSKNQTPLDLAKERAVEIVPLLEKNVNLFINKTNHAISKKLVPTKPTIKGVPVKGTVSVQVMPAPGKMPSLSSNKLSELLLKPKQNKQQLEMFGKIFEHTNPFIHVSGQDFVPPAKPEKGMETDNLQQQPLYSCFQKTLDNEKAQLEKRAALFQQIFKEIKNFDTKLTYPQRYHRILKVIDKAIQEKFSIYGIFAELLGMNYLEVLINLSDGKSPMHVAIEAEDLDALREIVAEKKERQNEVIIYKKMSMSEVDFAISIGQVNIVKAFIELIQKDPSINFGKIPEDAVIQAENKKLQLSTINPADKELEYYYDITKKKASEANLKKMLKTLMATLPCSEKESVYGMFTPQEYKIVQMLVGEKEGHKRSTFLSFRLNKMNNFLNSLLKYGNEEQQILAKEALQKFDKERMAENIKNVRIKNDIVKLKTIFKHATKYLPEILKNGKLVTPQAALSNGLVRLVSTPEGERNNIFFTQNSELNAITNFLLTSAEDEIRVDIISLLKRKKLKQSDIYTSLHLAAVKVERVENPDIYYAEDMRSKVIYAIYHFKKDDKDFKVHWYDKYEDNVLINSFYEIKTIDEEFREGDNCKSTAWDTIIKLRYLEKYGKYVLENVDKPHVVDAARASLNNVANIEGKITTEIDINDPAVTLVKNEEFGTDKNFDQKAMKELPMLITKGDVQKVKAHIEDNKIHKNTLFWPLLNAIATNNLSLTTYFLDIGVPTFYDNNRVLREAISNLRKTYIAKNRKLDDPDLQSAIKIIEALVGYGYADKNDSHIRHAATMDSFGFPPTMKWGNLTGPNLAILQTYLLTFEEPQLQSLCINNVRRFLPELYEFTFQQGLKNAHELIAKRLNKETKFADNEIQAALSLIKSKDTNAVKFCLDNVLKQQLEKLYYFVSYSILEDNQDLVSLCYPYFKQLIASGGYYNPLILAIKNNKIEIVKLLFTLGIPAELISQANEYARFTDFKEIQSLMVSKLYNNPEEALGYAIKYGLVDYVQNFSKQGTKLTIPSLGTIKQEVEKPFEKSNPLMYEAITQGNPDMIKALSFAYSKSMEPVPSGLDAYKKLLFIWCIEAIRQNKFDVFKAFLDDIFANDKIFQTLFCTKDYILLYHVVELASPKFLTEVIEYIRKLSQAKANKIYNFEYNLESNPKGGGGYNYLHRALECNRLDNLDVLRKSTSLSFTTSVVKDDLNLLEFTIECTYDVVNIFDKLINDCEIKIPNNIHKKAKILTSTIFCKQEDLIRHLFSKGHFSKEEVSSENKNYIQLVHEELNKVGSKGTTTAQFEKMTVLLCDELGIDINHKDANAQCVFQYPYQEEKCSYRFRIALAQCKSANISSNTETGTVLHTIPPIYFSEELLQNFIEKGGDINAVNAQGITLREYFALASGNYNSNVTKKFIELGATARSFFPGRQLNLGILTTTVNKVLYTLACDKKFIVYVLFNGYGTPLIPGLAHYHRGNPKKLPPTKDLLPNRMSGIEWIPMPTEFHTDTKGFHFAENNYPISELFMEMSKYIVKYQDAEKRCLDEKEKSKMIYPLNSQESEQLNQVFASESKKIHQLYENILKDDVLLQDLRTTLENINPSAMMLPYNAHVFYPTNEVYQEITFYSPLAAAVISKNLEKINLLLDAGFKDSEMDNFEKTSLKYSLKIKQPEIVKVLLEKQKVDIDTVLTCLSKLEKIDVNTIKTLLEYTKKFKLTQDNRNKLSTLSTNYLNQFKDKLSETDRIELEEIIGQFQTAGSKRPARKSDKNEEPSNKKSKKSNVPVFTVGTQPPLVQTPVAFFGGPARGSRKRKGPGEEETPLANKKGGGKK